MIDPTFLSYLLAARTIRYWYARGAIQADSLCQLIHIATYAALPCIRKAARRVVGEVGCAHMISAGERRGAVG